MAVRDWIEWHRRYDDPESSLSARLRTVRRQVGDALEALGSDRRRVLSLCSGDGRDLLPELALRPGGRPEVLLVDLEPSFADGARRAVADAGLMGVEVRTADAGDPASFDDRLPVDLLLLCGIFGNVEDAAIRATLGAVPAMVAPGGFVIWTRGRFDDVDLRPEVRQWSVDTGLVEVAYEGEPSPFGVGCYQVPDGLTTAPLPPRLFTFVP